VQILTACRVAETVVTEGNYGLPDGTKVNLEATKARAGEMNFGHVVETQWRAVRNDAVALALGG